VCAQTVAHACVCVCARVYKHTTKKVDSGSQGGIELHPRLFKFMRESFCVSHFFVRVDSVMKGNEQRVFLFRMPDQVGKEVGEKTPKWGSVGYVSETRLCVCVRAWTSMCVCMRAVVSHTLCAVCVVY